jgi:hypothetical protein
MKQSAIEIKEVDNVMADFVINDEAVREVNQTKKAYVCAENGLNVRNDNDIIIGKLSNAVQVDILGYTDEEIEVYDNNEILKGRKAIIEYYLETVDYSRTVRAYVFEGYLCDSNAVKIYDSELCIFKYEQDAYHQKPKCLDSILKLELVSKKITYNSILKRETKLTNIDGFKVEDNILKLPVKNDSLTIRNINDENAEDSREVYNYLGEIDALNCYVVSGNYWESGDVTLYNKITGKETAILQDYPQLSPNNRYLLSLSFDGYQEIGMFQLGKIENGKLENLLNFEFHNWTVTEKPDIIWVSNNTFLINVVHINAYWQENGSYNDNYQRLKITIL